jgi:hypothetical protein
MNPAFDPTAITILLAVWIVGCLAFLLIAAIVWMLESRFGDWIDRVIWHLPSSFDFELAEREFPQSSPADEQYPAA